MVQKWLFVFLLSLGYIRAEKIPITIYWGRVEPAFLSQLTTSIEREESGIFIISADIFSPSPCLALSDGKGLVSLLNGSGVDAILFSPEILALGTERMGDICDSAEFYLLGANIFNKETSKPLAHSYFIKTFKGVRVGIIGVCPELSARISGIEIKDHNRVLKNLIKLMRMRADIVGVISSSKIEIQDADFFVFLEKDMHKNRMGKLRLTLSDRNIVKREKGEIGLGEFIPQDSIMEAMFLEYQRISDSAVVKLEDTLSAKDFEEAIAKAILKSTPAKGVVIKKMNQGLFPGEITAKELFSLLPFRGHIRLVKCSEEEIHSIENKSEFSLYLKPGETHKVAVVAPIFEDRETELSSSSLLKMVIEYLNAKGIPSE